MRLVEFTLAFNGRKVSINPRHIKSVYRYNPEGRPPGLKPLKAQTSIHDGEEGSWDVTEPYPVVVDMINKQLS